MPKYRYIVINEENKQLQGTISGPDEQSARKELSDLGFVIVSFQQIAEQPQEAQDQIPTFEFSAIDKTQKHITGTIQAKEKFAAFKRLVSEYDFEVQYILDAKLNEEQKQIEIKKGAFDLYSQLEKEEQSVVVKESIEEKDLREFQKKQEVLKKQITFVLSKVNELLGEFNDLMKPEVKQKIKELTEKILRIKDSTNLDYIRKSTEELLLYLQKEELFLHEEARMKERTQMLIEAKSLMMQMKSGSNKSSLDFGDALRQWQKEHILEKEHPTKIDLFLNNFVKIIAGEKESREIVELKKEIAIINQHIKQYVLLYFQAPSPEFKAETKEGLKKLWIKRKELIGKLKNKKIIYKQEYAKHKEMEGKAPESGWTGEILAFTGWLLAFYLIYYFASIYAVSKDFGFTQLPPTVYIYKSIFMKYFLTILFLFHSSLSIKINIFRDNAIASLLMPPAFIIATLFILFNF